MIDNNNFSEYVSEIVSRVQRTNKSVVVSTKDIPILSFVDALNGKLILARNDRVIIKTADNRIVEMTIINRDEYIIDRVTAVTDLFPS